MGCDLSARAEWVKLIAHHRAHRAEGVKALGARPLAILFLDIPGGAVIHANVAANVWPHVGAGGKLAAALSDDNAELAFIVDALGHARGRQLYFFFRTDDAGGRLKENERLEGNITSELAGVLAIISSHAYDL